MQYQLYKTKKKLKYITGIEKTQLLLKSILCNLNLPFYIRQSGGLKLFKLDISSIRNRCLITNKSRSVFNHFKLSRIKLRWLASNGYINAIKKTNY